MQLEFIQKLENKLDTAIQKVQELRNENQQLQQQKKDLTIELEKIRDENDQFTLELLELRENYDALEQQKQQLVTEKESLLKNIEEKEGQIAGLENDIAAHVAQSNQMKNGFSQLKDKVEHLLGAVESDSDFPEIDIAENANRPIQ